MDSHPDGLTLHIQINPRIDDNDKIRGEFYSLLYGKHADCFIDWTIYPDCKKHFFIQYFETMLFQVFKKVLWREPGILTENTQRRNDTIKMLSKIQEQTETKVFSVIDKLDKKSFTSKNASNIYVHILKFCVTLKMKIIFSLR